MRTHPGTLSKHAVLYNSFALRQQREFTRAKPPGTIRVGVFGDSFTANIALPTQDTLTEPLDFLLNRTAGQKFEVLNFGVPGYETDQSYLCYVNGGAGFDLDIVVYMYFQNDLADNLNNNLFDLDEAGALAQVSTKAPRRSTRLLRRVYTTYLVLEVAGTVENALESLRRDTANPGDGKLRMPSSEVRCSGHSFARSLPTSADVRESITASERDAAHR